MATVTYKVKDLSTGTIYTDTGQTIVITVYPSANEANVSICWGGITETKETCYTCSSETCCCESVYIGENTDCGTTKQYSGTFTWNGFTIKYIITQGYVPCPPCDSFEHCELTNYHVDPYYVDYDTTSVTVYYSYNHWYTDSNCDIVRTQEEDSKSVGITPSRIPCDATGKDRELNVDFIDGCGTSHTAKCYVQKPDVCCDDPSEHTCYVINDIVYSPSIVPSSGANVSYYFDYKKIESKNCIEKITFGRYEGTWEISACDSDEEKATQRCCRDHIEKKKLSDLVSDWDDKELCSGKMVGETELSIIQTKNPSYTGDCSNVCEQDTGYCVDFSTITTYYKDENDEWIPWGRWNGNGDACSITARSESLNCSGNMNFGISTDEASWTWLDPNYELPYFGGSMRVTWEYSAYTVYEDCTTSMTRSYDSCDNCGYIAETIGETCPECESTNISHNRLIWEDILDILPYEGECYDELKNQCGIISIKSEEANRCDGGTTKFEFAINENVEPDYVINTIKYIFKKAPCELTDKDRFPETIGALCDTGETEDNGDCNKFTIKYKQKKTICDDECGSCIKTHDEGVFVCSKCGYKIGAYEDKTTHKMKPYADKCPICETEFKTGETETDYQVLSDSMTYYLPSALTDRKFTDSDCYDTTCTLKLIDKPFWVTAVTVNEGSITYEVEDNTGSDREGGVTFQLNGRDCYDTVLLSQYGTRESEECNCKSMFEVYSSAKILPSNGGNKLKIGTYIFDDCIDESSVVIGGGDVCSITSSTSSLDCSGTVRFGISTSHSSSVKPDWINNITFEDGYIYGDVEVNQSNPPQDRTGILSVAHMADGVACSTKEIEIKQSKGNCTVTLDVSGDRCPGTELIITPNFND